MIPTIIVEDEIHSANVLMRQIERNNVGLQIIGVAENLDNAIKLISQKKPALVFMDIEIPGGNAFAILDAFDTCNFAVIFITAFEHYALKAIKYSALDYLLKPVATPELLSAIEKAKQNIEQKTLQIKLKELKRNLEASPDDQRLIVNSKDALQTISIKDLIYLEANGSYTKIYIENKSPIFSSRHLKDYESILPQHTFFRIHHSVIVNRDKISNIKKGKATSVILTDNTTIQVSVRRVPDFLEFIKARF